MHEKALQPYIGMTTHTILIKQESCFFDQKYQQQLKDIDMLISKKWHSKQIASTRDLNPFPLLGVPGYWPGQQDEIFYQNRDYFRIKNTR